MVSSPVAGSDLSSMLSVIYLAITRLIGITKYNGWAYNPKNINLIFSQLIMLWALTKGYLSSK